MRDYFNLIDTPACICTCRRLIIYYTTNPDQSIPVLYDYQHWSYYFTAYIIK
jgi:hypothetical protein